MRKKVYLQTLPICNEKEKEKERERRLKSLNVGYLFLYAETY
jgi:hypothetical protein